MNPEQLLYAETTLKLLGEEMHAEYEKSEGKWPRAWMVKHMNDRKTLIMARKILTDRAEKGEPKG